MKQKIEFWVLKLVLAIGFIACDIALFAQPPGGPPPGGGGGTTGTLPPCWQPECVPIDGGLGFLIVAGAALGAKKIYGSFK